MMVKTEKLMTYGAMCIFVGIMLYVFQQEIKLRFYLGIAMNPFRDDFFRACRPQLAHLPIKVLPLLFPKRAAGEAIVFAHDRFPSVKSRVKGRFYIFRPLKAPILRPFRVAGFL